MDIYKAIQKDHSTQRTLCDKIVQTSGDSKERRELWRELKKELQVHAVAEERYFYKPLITTDKMQEDARHGMAEHHEMDELIRELDKTDMSSPHWLPTVVKLKEKVEHHLKDEENEFFAKARNVYDEKKAQSLASDYNEAMARYREGWPDAIPGND